MESFISAEAGFGVGGGETTLKCFRASDLLRMGWSRDQIRYQLKIRVLCAEKVGIRVVFRFGDLVLLRMMRRLRNEGVPVRRLYRAVRNLRAQVPEGSSVESVTLSWEGACLVASCRAKRWLPETGQLLLPWPEE